MFQFMIDSNNLQLHWIAATHSYKPPCLPGSIPSLQSETSIAHSIYLLFPIYTHLALSDKVCLPLWSSLILLYFRAAVQISATLLKPHLMATPS